MTHIGSISEFKGATLAKLASRDTAAVHYPIAAEDLTVRTQCPACGSGNVVDISAVHLDRGLKFLATSACGDCLFVYRSTFPSFRWFKARWAQIASGKLEVYNEALEAVREARYRDYAALLQSHRSGGRLLEIGAGYGSGARVLKDAGFEVEALEPEDDRALYINQAMGIRCHSVALEEFTPDAPYDLIVCAHNLEHVDDPKAELHRMAGWLKPDGLLYCEVPVVWNFVDWADSLFMAHKTNFSEATLARMMADCGFSHVATTHPRLNTPNAADLGVLVSRDSSGDVAESWGHLLSSDAGRSIADVKAAYRRLAPDGLTFGDADPIRISVPHISHFFHVVRADEGAFEDRRGNTGFIEFVLKG